jgi:hypothetical protein
MPILQAGDIKFVIYEMVRESSDVNIPEMLATEVSFIDGIFLKRYCIT